MLKSSQPSNVQNPCWMISLLFLCNQYIGDDDVNPSERGILLTNWLIKPRFLLFVSYIRLYPHMFMGIF